MRLTQTLSQKRRVAHKQTYSDVFISFKKSLKPYPFLLKPFLNSYIVNVSQWYNLFKIFSVSKFTQIPGLILQNQPELNKFGRRLRYLGNMS